jgi:RNA polymerase sigma-70 factor (ECF subfamily)
MTPFGSVRRWPDLRIGPETDLSGLASRIARMSRDAAVRGKMVVPGPRLATAGHGEEMQLAAEGSTESVAVPLRATRAPSPSKALDRRRERRWIKAAQGGSEEALEHLYKRHWPWAHRAAYLVVHDGAAAEDIAQEAFLAAIRSLDRFDRRRPFGPWLNRIVVNRAIDWARARSLRGETGTVPEGEAASAAHLEPRELSSSVYSDEVVAALQTLSPEQRALIVLRYLLEYTPGEIAEALGLPRGTVNSRLRRGLDRLATEMEAR